jgi:hypothetical protein
MFSRYLDASLTGLQNDRIINSPELHFSEAILETIPRTADECARAIRMPVLEPNCGNTA